MTEGTESPRVRPPIAEQWDRRRDAGLHLEPLPDGRRDPWVQPWQPLDLASAYATERHLQRQGLWSDLQARVVYPPRVLRRLGLGAA